MVRFYAENVSWVCNESDKPDHAACPALDSAGRNVRHLGDDRIAADRFLADDRFERFCKKLINIADRDGAVTFDVRVVPRSSRSEIVGEHDGALKVRIASPPVDGAANEELIKLLAKHFDVSKSDVEIVAGETSKSKRIKIANLSQSRFEEVMK